MTAAKEALLGNHHQDDYHPELHQQQLLAGTATAPASGYAAPATGGSRLSSDYGALNSSIASSTVSTQPVIVKQLGGTAGTDPFGELNQLPHERVGLATLTPASQGQHHAHGHHHEHHKVSNPAEPIHGVLHTTAAHGDRKVGVRSAEGMQQAPLMHVADAAALQEGKLQAATHGRALAPAGVQPRS